jgi:hypothetical protein
MRVRVATGATHTTTIFQVLDLTLCGIFKRDGQYHLSFETETRTANFIFKSYEHFRSTLIGANIWAPFQAIDLSLHNRSNVQRMLFNEIILRQNPGFSELWVIDCPSANLSARRRNAKFGWINKAD